MQIGSVVWEEFDHIHTYIHMEFGQCGSQYTRNAQYQTCFAGFDNVIELLITLCHGTNIEAFYFDKLQSETIEFDPVSATW